MIGGPAGGAAMQLAVYYLKNATADDASQLLKQLLVAEAQSSPIAAAQESMSAIAIKTFGSPQVIELQNVRAEQVAAIIRDAYAGRIGATAEERREAAEQLRRQSPVDRNSAPATAATAQLAQQSGERPQMTLAVDTQGNSLVVTAPEQLAQEVRSLALRIDDQGQRIVRVMSTK